MLTGGNMVPPEAGKGEVKIVQTFTVYPAPSREMNFDQ